MLIYSRATPEWDQEPLQWPEDVVVRGTIVYSPLILSNDADQRTSLYNCSGPFSATISFSLETSRRM
jgi:hypothetical protein